MLSRVPHIAAADGRADDVAQAVVHGRLALMYAANRAIAVPAEVIATLTESKRALANGGLPPADEARLWKALIDVAQLIRPATVPSIVAMTQPDQDRRLMGFMPPSGVSSCERAVRRYRRWTIAVLSTLLVIQTYWLVGATAAGETERIPAELETNRATIAALNARSPADPDQQVATLETTNDRLEYRLATSYEVLTWWTSWWAGRGRIERAEAGNEEGAKSVEKRRRRKMQAYYTTEAKAKLALQSFQSFLLPALYGLLGTCVFILRTLSSEIRTVSYESDVGYRIRLPMGALAGIAVAWFIKPNGDDALFKSVPPLALAFLAGYSVELLFAAMDRFVTAFSGSGTPQR